MTHNLFKFKTLFLFFILTIHGNNFAKGIYTEIVTLTDSIDHKILYSAAREWVAKTFVSANDVVQLADADASKIIVKGCTEELNKVGLHILYPGRIHFTLTIQCKNGRYKYTVDNIIHKAVHPKTGDNMDYGPVSAAEPYGGFGPSGRITRKGWDSVKEQADKLIESIIFSLKKAMKKATQKEDW